MEPGELFGMASDTKSLEPDGATGTESEGNAEQGPSPRRDTGPLHLETAFGDATFMAEGDADMVLRAFESFKAHDAAHHRPRTPPPPPPRPRRQSPKQRPQPKRRTRRTRTRRIRRRAARPRTSLSPPSS